jgi:plasmid stabilization system protein ParE
MVAPRIDRTPRARQDLMDIWTHVAAEATPSVADTFLARIYGALEIVAYAPFIGRERSEFRGMPRSIAVHPYVVFYQPLAEGDGIVVWRVLHGARKLSSRLVRGRTP